MTHLCVVFAGGLPLIERQLYVYSCKLHIAHQRHKIVRKVYKVSNIIFIISVIRVGRHVASTTLNNIKKYSARSLSRQSYSLCGPLCMSHTFYSWSQTRPNAARESQCQETVILFFSIIILKYSLCLVQKPARYRRERGLHTLLFSLPLSASW